MPKTRPGGSQPPAKCLLALEGSRPQLPSSRMTRTAWRKVSGGVAGTGTAEHGPGWRGGRGAGYRVRRQRPSSHTPLPRLATQGPGIWPGIGPALRQPRGVISRTGGAGPVGSAGRAVPSSGAQAGGRVQPWEGTPPYHPLRGSDPVIPRPQQVVAVMRPSPKPSRVAVRRRPERWVQGGGLGCSTGRGLSHKGTHQTQWVTNGSGGTIG